MGRGTPLFRCARLCVRRVAACAPQLGGGVPLVPSFHENKKSPLQGAFFIIISTRRKAEGSTKAALMKKHITPRKARQGQATVFLLRKNLRRQVCPLTCFSEREKNTENRTKIVPLDTIETSPGFLLFFGLVKPFWKEPLRYIVELSNRKK